MGQQASVIVKMSDYDLCLMGVLACCVVLYNAQIEKITPAGGWRSHAWTRNTTYWQSNEICLQISCLAYIK